MSRLPFLPITIPWVPVTFHWVSDMVLQSVFVYPIKSENEVNECFLTTCEEINFMEIVYSMQTYYWIFPSCAFVLELQQRLCVLLSLETNIFW